MARQFNTAKAYDRKSRRVDTSGKGYRYNMECQDSFEQVLKLVGRNVILFQRLEASMKLLLNESDKVVVCGLNSSEVQYPRESAKSTLGKLLGDIQTPKPVKDADVISVDDIPSDQIGISTRFQFPIELYFSKAELALLKELKEERNVLVHHFYDSWEPTSKESCLERVQYLTDLRLRVHGALDMLAGAADSLLESQAKVAQQITSRETLEAQFVTSSIMSALVNIVDERSDEDGWVMLSEAGGLLRKRIPNDMDALKTKFGIRQLNHLIRSIDGLELGQRELQNGEKQYAYRVDTSTEELSWSPALTLA